MHECNTSQACILYKFRPLCCPPQLSSAFRRSTTTTTPQNWKPIEIFPVVSTKCKVPIHNIEPSSSLLISSQPNSCLFFSLSFERSLGFLPLPSLTFHIHSFLCLSQCKPIEFFLVHCLSHCPDLHVKAQALSLAKPLTGMIFILFSYNTCRKKISRQSLSSAYSGL